MNSETSIPYAAYELYPRQFVIRPDSIKCCPLCGGTLSKSNISPSKAVASFLAAGIMPHHNFSHLYECPACHWWAVWESYIDAEYSPDFHVLIASQNADNQALSERPWRQALEDENVYDHVYDPDMLLPESLEQVLIGGKKRILDLPNPGDKVRLAGDVHMLQDLELIPLFISGSEGMVISNEELYAFFKEENKQEAELEAIEWKDVGIDDWDVDEYIKVQFGHLKSTLEAMNSCPIRLEKLVVSDERWLRDSCKEGNIYYIYAADLMKLT